MEQRYFRTVLMAGALLVVAGSASAASVVYREVFPVDTTASDNQEQLENQGWYGGNTGDLFGALRNNNPNEGSGGEGAIGGGAPFASEQMPVNSNPVGSLASTAYAFQSQRAISSLFLYTTEFSIASSLLEHVSWDSRNNANATNTTASGGWFGQGTIDGVDSHVAIRVDTGISKDWYVSTTGFLHMGDNQTWLTNTADIGSLMWYVFGEYGNGPSDGSVLPGTNFGLLSALPNGRVDAIGLYTARSGGNVRIDNFTVSAVPVPAALPMLATALAGLGYMRRRRSRG